MDYIMYLCYIFSPPYILLPSHEMLWEQSWVVAVFFPNPFNVQVPHSICIRSCLFLLV